MNKSATAFAWSFPGLEMARMFVEYGYVPLRFGEKIDAVNDPLFFWLVVGALLFSVMLSIANFVRSIVKERKRPASTVECGMLNKAFLSGKHTIAYSSSWLGRVIVGLVVLWAVYVAFVGNPDQSAWFLGSWFSALFFLCVATFLGAWSVGVSKSGNTMVFKRLSMVTGNLELPASSSGMNKEALIIRRGSAEYRISMIKLAKRDREILCAVFNCHLVQRADE